MPATCGADAKDEGGSAAVAAARGTEEVVGAEAAIGFEEPATGRLLLASSKKSEGRAAMDDFAADEAGATVAAIGLREDASAQHRRMQLDEHIERCTSRLAL